MPIETKKNGVSRISGAKADLYCIYFYYYFASLYHYIFCLSVCLSFWIFPGIYWVKEQQEKPLKLKVMSVKKIQFKRICLPHTTNMFLHFGRICIWRRIRWQGSQSFCNHWRVNDFFLKRDEPADWQIDSILTYFDK